MNTDLDVAFVKNRAEEIGYDVWAQFAIPPFYDRLDLQNARKPCVVVGGRGCGKTMLLRYLSHQSTFSPQRHTIPTSAIELIGLYWKADTQFAQILIKRGVSDETWQAAFDHAMAVKLAGEILSSLKSIANSKCSIITPSKLNQLEFKTLKDFSPALNGNFEDIQSALNSDWRKFLMWSNNPRKLPEPDFLPCRVFLMALIVEIQFLIPALQRSTFMVYIDEYENLREYQRRTINTYLKHSEPPLIFNIAAKRNAFVDRRTLGTESITDIADYRTIDIEELLGNDFRVFSAEIMFLNLAMISADLSPIDISDLRDVPSLEKRHSEEYRNRILAEARRIMPSMNSEQLAKEAFSDTSIRNRLESEITQTLKRRKNKLNASDFISEQYPQASIVSSALLNRDSLTPEDVKKEFDYFVTGKKSKFASPTDWMHNNFIGCLLRLYDLGWKVCPFYGGFDSFCLLSRGNLRHFLELCHKSIKQGKFEGKVCDFCIGTSQQAQAAFQASSAFLREVRSLGQFGNAIHSFVVTLGSLFALSHERSTQSEPEVSHFAIAKGSNPLSPEDEDFLKEAVKWSVLFEERETKVKTDLQMYGSQWVLNPIYAPYFRITYRKRRKLELTTDEIIILIRGTYDDRRRLLKSFQAKWEVQSDDLSPTLFTHLEGDPHED